LLTKPTTNRKGEKITAAAHNGPINIQGITIAQVNEKLQVQTLETWFDPLEMFRQIDPTGIALPKEATQKPDYAAAQIAQNDIPAAGTALAPESITAIGHEADATTAAAKCPFLSSRE
jgi:hypothetical protein